MPLGDSITDGIGGTNAGYRAALHGLLTQSQVSFQFVGSAFNNPGTLPLDQIHHEGHSGFAITAGTSGREGISDNIATWLGPTGADPNVILMMIGTNDVDIQYDLTHAQGRLDALVTRISDKTDGLKPNARLIVAQIVPIANADEELGRRPTTRPWQP